MYFCFLHRYVTAEPLRSVVDVIYLYLMDFADVILELLVRDQSIVLP